MVAVEQQQHGADDALATDSLKSSTGGGARWRMSLVQKQAGASKGRKFGAHTASKRPSLAGIDMMQLFFKAGELEKRSNRGFWQKRHFETLNSYLCC